MARATRTVVFSLIVLIPALSQSPAWAQPGPDNHSDNDSDNVRLTPGASVDLAVPGGWLGTALTSRDGDLWVGAQSTRGPSMVLQFTPSGAVLGQVKTASDGNVGGIAFDGDGVCALDYSTNMKSGQRVLSRLATDGTVRKAAVSASGAHNTFGLAWHGSGFFQGHSPTVTESSVIYRLTADGRQQSSHKMPFYTRGMTWHDNELWVTTGYYRTLHVLDRDLNIVRSYQLSVALADIAFVGGAFYGLEQNSNRLHRFEMPVQNGDTQVLAASNGVSADRGWLAP